MVLVDVVRDRATPCIALDALDDAFRYAMAAGAAALLSPGTKLCDPADVERMYREVVVTAA